jgi:LCP family protein required for cell wall assembly
VATSEDDHLLGTVERMASGSRGGPPGRNVLHGSVPNEDGLRALGAEIEQREPGSVAPDDQRPVSGAVDGAPSADAPGPVANEAGLRALGEQIDQRHGVDGDGQPGNGRSPAGGGGRDAAALAAGAPAGALAATRGRTAAPGRPVPSDPSRPGPPPLHKPHRKRWSTRRKVLTVLGAFVLLALILAGAGYGYLRYEWSQVKSINCSSCAVVNGNQPFNVLLVGSDSRAGNSGQAAQSFGSQSQVGGQRSDTIKIAHINPATGTAEILSIPRDTYVTMSGLPQSSGLTGTQKINTAFNDGPNPLIQTIKNTFGIPISHFVIVNFTGLINGVNELGGINLDFRYPVRDDDNGNNNSGLDITQTGCQTLNGTMTLALARSRYYQYYDDGQWNSDPTSDIGRITRQNAIIEAIIAKAKSTYNPFTLHSFIDSAVHDIEVDTNMGFSTMYDLAERYHAFSPSSLKTYTLPVTAATTPGGSDVETVNEPAAEQTIQAFLGTAPSTPSTPPVDAYGNPINVPPPTTTTAPVTSPHSSTTPAPSAPPSATPAVEPYDPTPC